MLSGHSARQTSEAYDILPDGTTLKTGSVVQWSEFLATDLEVPGSIPGATTFSE
jgi:hypothetical protein